MKYILTTILFCLSLVMYAQVNQIDSSGMKQGRWVKKYENGKTRYTGTFNDDIPVGTFKYYYEGEGRVMSEIVYRGETGIGFATAYHSNGQLQAKGLYNNQRKDSLWTYYDLTGILTQTCVYREGVKHGDEITYFENGVIAERISYVDGLKQGPWILKWEDGKKRTEATFVNDQLNGECKHYDTNGKLLSKGEYRLGLKHNTWYYYSGGKMTKKQEFIKGSLKNEKVYDESEE
jgi:antitoxin component YwqK of YwqJK toxin-antitoxin module